MKKLLVLSFIFFIACNNGNNPTSPVTEEKETFTLLYTFTGIAPYEVSYPAPERPRRIVEHITSEIAAATVTVEREITYPVDFDKRLRLEIVNSTSNGIIEFTTEMKRPNILFKQEYINRTNGIEQLAIIVELPLN